MSNITLSRPALVSEADLDNQLPISFPRIDVSPEVAKQVQASDPLYMDMSTPSYVDSAASPVDTYTPYDNTIPLQEPTMAEPLVAPLQDTKVRPQDQPGFLPDTLGNKVPEWSDVGKIAKKPFEPANYASATLPLLGILESIFTKGKGKSFLTAMDAYSKGSAIGERMGKAGAENRGWKATKEFIENNVTDPSERAMLLSDKKLAYDYAKKHNTVSVKPGVKKLTQGNIDTVFSAKGDDEYAKRVKDQVQTLYNMGDTKGASKVMSEFILNDKPTLTDMNSIIDAVNIIPTDASNRIAIAKQINRIQDPLKREKLYNKYRDVAMTQGFKESESKAKRAMLQFTFDTGKDMAEEAIKKLMKGKTLATELGKLKINSVLRSLDPEAKAPLWSLLGLSNYRTLSSDAKNYLNGLQLMIRSVLRRESGAAITAGEWSQMFAQYLPTIGDSYDNIRKKWDSLVGYKKLIGAGNDLRPLAVDEVFGKQLPQLVQEKGSFTLGPKTTNLYNQDAEALKAKLKARGYKTMILEDGTEIKL